MFLRRILACEPRYSSYTKQSARWAEQNDFLHHPRSGKHVFKHAVEMTELAGLNFATQELNVISSLGSLPEHELEFKKGFMVMLLQNFHLKIDNAIETRSVLEKITSKVIFRRGATESCEGRTHTSTFPCDLDNDKFLVLCFQKTQLFCTAMLCNWNEQSARPVFQCSLENQFATRLLHAWLTIRCDVEDSLSLEQFNFQ